MRFPLSVLPLVFFLVVPAVVAARQDNDCPVFTVPVSWTEVGHSPDGSTRTYTTGADTGRGLSVLVRYFKSSQETPMGRAVQELKDLTVRGVGIVASPHPIKVGMAVWVALEWEKAFFDAASGQKVSRGQQYYAESPGGGVLLEVTFIGEKDLFEAFGADGPLRFLATCVWEPCRPVPAADLDLADFSELQKIGREYFEAGQYGRAIEVGEKALAKAGSNKDRAEIYYLMSSAYLEQKGPDAYQKAEAYAEKCLAILPRHWRALKNEARIATIQGDLERADGLFTKAESFMEEESPEAKDLITQHSALTSVIKLRSLKRKEMEAAKASAEE